MCILWTLDNDISTGYCNSCTLSPDSSDVMVRFMILQLGYDLHIEQEFLVQANQWQSLVDEPFTNGHFIK